MRKLHSGWKGLTLMVVGATLSQFDVPIWSILATTVGMVLFIGYAYGRLD